MRKHSNSLDWCFDCKQVKGMKSNANKKTRIYLKNHFCSWFVSCFRNKIYKLLIYKWLNSYILNLADFCIRIKAKHFHQICPSPARHTKIGNVFQTTRFGRGIVDTSCRVIDKCPARSHPFGPKRRKCSVIRSKAVFSPVGAPTQPVGVVPRMGHTTPSQPPDAFCALLQAASSGSLSSSLSVSYLFRFMDYRGKAITRVCRRPAHWSIKWIKTLKNCCRFSSGKPVWAQSPGQRRGRVVEPFVSVPALRRSRGTQMEQRAGTFHPLPELGHEQEHRQGKARTASNAPRRPTVGLI